MNRNELAQIFINALSTQVVGKSLMKDGIHTKFDPYRILASITEEAGEVSSELQRGRIYGAVQECIDVAHSALLLAIILDEDGVILKHVSQKTASFTEEN